MDPLTGVAIGAPIASGIFGLISNSSANERAQMLNNKALRRWLEINIPNPEDQKLALEEFVLQGTFSPQLEQAIKQDPSAFEQIATSEQHKSAQNRALSKLEQLGYEGGLSLKDKADLEEAQLREQSRSKGNRDAIRAEMHRRGLGGSGFEAVARLADESASAEQAHKNALQTQAHAQNRALEAIRQAGELGTSLRGQEFGEKAQKAAAADRIARFNAENLADVSRRNVERQNQGQQYNLEQRQGIHNKNVAQRNYQQEHNKGLGQQRFENESRVAAGASGQYGNLAQGERQQGQSMANFYGNLGTAAGAGAAAAKKYNYLDDYFDQQRKKSKQYA